MWQKRKSASLAVDFYHQSQLSITIPIDSSKATATDEEK
jgi:hypothetical protein